MSSFKIRHITSYKYEQAVRDSANQIMLYPIEDEWQKVVSHKVVITGNPQVNIHLDYYGNQIGTFTHAHPHQELTIDSQLSVVTRERAMPIASGSAEEQWNWLRTRKNELAFIDFLKQENFEALAAVKEVVGNEQGAALLPLESARHLCSYVFNTFAYQKGITTVETTIDEVWKLRSGVCQDFAHILLVMLRLMEIPARYVSGYICPNKNGMRGEGATHAWVEAFLPGHGWLGLDPTNNCVVNETHVRLAVGKNFLDCSPVKGTYRGTSNHIMEVSVAVSYEDGHTSSPDHSILQPATPSTSSYKNSFHRYQEMQMQQ